MRTRTLNAIVLTIFLFSSMVLAQHFTPPSHIYNPMSIWIKSANLVEPMDAGDEIAVFDGSLCVGAVVLDGPIGATPVQLNAIMKDPSGGDGFIQGHEILFKAWFNDQEFDLAVGQDVFFIDLGDASRISPVPYSGLGTAAVEIESPTLPVELTSFAARKSAKGVELTWQTASETNNYGFEIQRAQNNEWEKIGFVNGHSTTSKEQNYSFTDGVNSGSFSYRLKQIDTNGSYTYSKIVQVNLTPGAFNLGKNYPNPFNPATVIPFSLAKENHVKLDVFNVQGQRLMTLVNETRAAGEHKVEFNASNLPTGVYIYVMTAGNFTSIQKMALTK